MIIVWIYVGNFGLKRLFDCFMDIFLGVIYKEIEINGRNINIGYIMINMCYLYSLIKF